MCQAIPRCVLQIDRERLLVDYDDHPTWVSAVALKDVQVGEYVVVYAGEALERMDTTAAEEMLAWYANLEKLLEEATG